MNCSLQTLMLPGGLQNLSFLPTLLHRAARYNGYYLNRKEVDSSAYSLSLCSKRHEKSRILAGRLSGADRYRPSLTYLINPLQIGSIII